MSRVLGLIVGLLLFALVGPSVAWADTSDATAHVAVTADGTTTHLHQDRLGSTRLLTATDGSPAGTANYTPYGQATTTGTQSRLGFTGHYTDVDTGLISMRARYYDPQTGQFLTRDPLEDVTGDPYAYTAGDPINHTDPTGLILGIPGTPSTTQLINTIAGAGDAYTFGATAWIRRKLGNDNVDYCSGAYRTGGYLALALPGPGKFRLASSAAKGATRLVEGARYPLSPKIQGHLAKRGWTTEAIDEAVQSGKQVRAVNKATGNPATRYIHPTTGQSVVIDDVTGQVIHVGGPGFKYGPGSGDVP